MTQILGYSPNPLTGVEGSGQVENTTLGFFGVTPIAKKTHFQDPAANVVELSTWALNVNLLIEGLGFAATS